MTNSLRDVAWDCLALDGVVEARRSETGLSLARLSRLACEQIGDPLLTITTSMAAGMRLRLITNSQSLEVEARLKGLQYFGAERRPIAFDLLVNRTPFTRYKVEGAGLYAVNFASTPPMVELHEAAPQRVVFAQLPAGLKTLELWLPHNAEVELLAVRVEADAEVLPVEIGEPSWVHYGSSISHGKEVEGPLDMWPARVARGLDLNITNLGFSGQCLLDGSVARAIAGIDAKVISLKLGANVVGSDAMRRRTFRSLVNDFLDMIREKQPKTPILVISPVYSPLMEDHPGPLARLPSGYATITRAPELAVDALTLTEVRRLLEECVALRRRRGDLALHYLDGRHLLDAPDVTRLVDGLHPDTLGHQWISERISPILAGLIL